MKRTYKIFGAHRLVLCAIALMSVLIVFTACTSDVEVPDTPGLRLRNFPATAYGEPVQGRWLAAEGSFAGRRIIGVAAGSEYNHAAIAPVKIPNDASEITLDIYEVNPVTGESLGIFTESRIITVYLSVLDEATPLSFAEFIAVRHRRPLLHNHPSVPFVNGAASIEADLDPGFHIHEDD